MRNALKESLHPLVERENPTPMDLDADEFLNKTYFNYDFDKEQDENFKKSDEVWKNREVWQDTEADKEPEPGYQKTKLRVDNFKMPDTMRPMTEYYGPMQKKPDDTTLTDLTYSGYVSKEVKPGQIGSDTDPVMTLEDAIFNRQSKMNIILQKELDEINKNSSDYTLEEGWAHTGSLRSNAYKTFLIEVRPGEWEYHSFINKIDPIVNSPFYKRRYSTNYISGKRTDDIARWIMVKLKHKSKENTFVYMGATIKADEIRGHSGYVKTEV